MLSKHACKVNYFCINIGSNAKKATPIFAFLASTFCSIRKKLL